jgi:1-phosphofructokinase
MIYTVTVNPSLDYIMRLDEFAEGETNRADTTELYPGGKGINVSTILSRLHQENTALGFVAGFTGRRLLVMLSSRQFAKEFVECEGYTRINVKLKSKVESEINGTGLILQDKDVQKLKERVSQLKKGDVLILSGSIPSELPKTIYKELMQKAGSDVLCVVDASGKLLENALEEKPFLIKPNQAELEEIFSQKLDNLEDLAKAARKLQEQGAQNVLVSRGSKGAMLAGMDGKIYLAGCPQGKLVNSVGSGDSMVAGFVTGYQTTKDLKEALKLGIYCGSATAFTSDLATKEDIDALISASPIEVTEL